MLLRYCIPSVQQQTYPNVEHIVVADGADPVLEHLIETASPLELGAGGAEWRGGHDVRYFELGHNHNDWGVSPRIAGTYLARGEYIAYLDDDNEYFPSHIEDLLGTMNRIGSDVVYSQQNRFPGGILGDGILEHGHIDASMILHKAEILWTRGNWRPAGYAADWDLVERWRDAGVRFGFLPKVTANYFIRGTRPQLKNLVGK